MTHEEARCILSRFINSHFRKQHMEGVECARFSIPYNANRDDDSLMSQYIAECESRDADLDFALAKIDVYEKERERERELLDEKKTVKPFDMSGRDWDEWHLEPPDPPYIEPDTVRMH